MADLLAGRYLKISISGKIPTWKLHSGGRENKKEAKKKSDEKEEMLRRKKLNFIQRRLRR